MTLYFFFCFFQIYLNAAYSSNEFAASLLNVLEAGQELEVVDDPSEVLQQRLSNKLLKNNIVQALSNGNDVQILPQSFCTVSGPAMPCTYEKALQLYERAISNSEFIQDMLCQLENHGRVTIYINERCSSITVKQELDSGRAPPHNFNKLFASQAYNQEKVRRDVINSKDTLLRLLLHGMHEAYVYYTQFGLIINRIQGTTQRLDSTLLEQFVKSDKVTRTLVYAVVHEQRVNFQDNPDDGTFACSSSDDVPDRPDDMKHYWLRVNGEYKLWLCASNPFQDATARLWLEKESISFANPTQLPQPAQASGDYPGNLPEHLKMPTTAEDLQKEYKRLINTSSHYEQQLYLLLNFSLFFSRF